MRFPQVGRLVGGLLKLKGLEWGLAAGVRLNRAVSMPVQFFVPRLLDCVLAHCVKNAGLQNIVSWCSATVRTQHAWIVVVFTTGR